MHSRICCHPHFPAPLLLKKKAFFQDPFARMEGSSQNHYRESGVSKIPNEPSMSEKMQSSDRRSTTERREGDLRW
jgi:hypothetical protein